MLKPFESGVKEVLHNDPSYLREGWEDPAFTDRKDPYSGYYVAPEGIDGDPTLVQGGRTRFRPDWEITKGAPSFTISPADHTEASGEVSAQLWLPPGDADTEHELMTHSTATFGQWFMSFAHGREYPADYPITGDVFMLRFIHDPASGEAWAVAVHDSGRVTIERWESDNSFTIVLDTRWKPAGSELYWSPQRHIRELDGRFESLSRRAGSMGTFDDPWLPTNPQRVTIGAYPRQGTYEGGKRSSNLTITRKSTPGAYGEHGRQYYLPYGSIPFVKAKPPYEDSYD